MPVLCRNDEGKHQHIMKPEKTVNQIFFIFLLPNLKPVHNPSVSSRMPGQKGYTVKEVFV